MCSDHVKAMQSLSAGILNIGDLEEDFVCSQMFADVGRCRRLTIAMCSIESFTVQMVDIPVSVLFLEP